MLPHNSTKHTQKNTCGFFAFSSTINRKIPPYPKDLRKISSEVLHQPVENPPSCNKTSSSNIFTPFNIVCLKSRMSSSLLGQMSSVVAKKIICSESRRLSTTRCRPLYTIQNNDDVV